MIAGTRLSRKGEGSALTLNEGGCSSQAKQNRGPHPEDARLFQTGGPAPEGIFDFAGGEEPLSLEGYYTFCERMGDVLNDPALEVGQLSSLQLETPDHPGPAS